VTVSVKKSLYGLRSQTTSLVSLEVMARIGSTGITFDLPVTPAQSELKAESSQHFATPKACDSKSSATEIPDNPFSLSAILSKAAPSAPPMWGRRSLQSRQAQAKRRRNLRVASMSMPSTNHPSGLTGGPCLTRTYHGGRQLSHNLINEDSPVARSGPASSEGDGRARMFSDTDSDGQLRCEIQPTT
jgi:hypothetical protein